MNEWLLGRMDGVRLTPAQRRIAACLLDRPGTAAYLSSAELATAARVSQPSVTRFALALGFDGYPALRRALRDNAGAAPGPDGARPPANDLQHALHGEMANLERLARAVADGSPERAAIAEAGKLLAASRPLPVLGLRAARPLADYFAYFAATVHPDVRVLGPGGSLLYDRMEQACAAGASALLAVVLPRYPREALDAVRHARSAGLHVLVLTDSPVSPAAALADLPLTAAVGARLVFDLHSAPMALAMLLIQAMCDADPAGSQARLEEFEASAARRGVFVA